MFSTAVSLCSWFISHICPCYKSDHALDWLWSWSDSGPDLTLLRPNILSEVLVEVRGVDWWCVPVAEEAAYLDLRTLVFPDSSTWWRSLKINQVSGTGALLRNTRLLNLQPPLLQEHTGQGQLLLLFKEIQCFLRPFDKTPAHWHREKEIHLILIHLSSRDESVNASDLLKLLHRTGSIKSICPIKLINKPQSVKLMNFMTLSVKRVAVWSQTEDDRSASDVHLIWVQCVCVLLYQMLRAMNSERLNQCVLVSSVCRCVTAAGSRCVTATGSKVKRWVRSSQVRQVFSSFRPVVQLCFITDVINIKVKATVKSKTFSTQ